MFRVVSYRSERKRKKYPSKNNKKCYYGFYAFVRYHNYSYPFVELEEDGDYEEMDIESSYFKPGCSHLSRCFLKRSPVKFAGLALSHPSLEKWPYSGKYVYPRASGF